MKINKEINVLEDGLNRFRFLFDEFEEVVVSFSGGKDSTVVLNLALQIAKEKDRLPLSVLFVDQECEWQSTVDYVKEVMYRKDIKPYWYQIPMVITNNASTTSRYHYCWAENEKEDWIHPQDPISIKENKYKTNRFHDLFRNIANVDFPDNTCYVAGVRTEEAPKRFVSLTNGATYKYITWGKQLNKKRGQYTFYPVYDWSYTDVWKYIQENKIKYNTVYDEMYRHGVTVNNMRVSNLHHETAIQALLLVQEIEPDTWNKVSKKIEGANTIKHIQKDSFACPRELPYMFENWKSYALHLAKNLVPDPENKALLDKTIERYKIFQTERPATDFWKVIINTILSSDFDFTKLKNHTMRGQCDTYRRFIVNPNGVNKEKYKWQKGMMKNTQYLNTEQKIVLMNYFKNERITKAN